MQQNLFLFREIKDMSTVAQREYSSRCGIRINRTGGVELYRRTDHSKQSKREPESRHSHDYFSNASCPANAPIGHCLSASAQHKNGADRLAVGN